MTLLALLAQATVEHQPVSLLGPYIVSVSGLFVGASALAKVAFEAGKFEEFKSNTKEKEASSSNLHAEFVARTELEVIVKHIDQRFDDVSRQLAEIRKLKLEGNGR